MDEIITVNSPTKGIMRVKVEQRDTYTVHFTLLDGISAGYGCGMKLHVAEVSSLSQTDIYNAAKDFIAQLDPSGYLDDGP